MKKILLFGSTGSIGRNVLDIVARNRDRFQIELLSCHSNAELLVKQALEFDVPIVHILDENAHALAEASLPATKRIFSGGSAFKNLIAETECDLVVNAIVGSAGLEVSYYALLYGKTLALANKESLVAGGELLKNVASKTGAHIIPIDSEHSAIFQCLQAGKHAEVEKIILTASGGPFRTRPKESFANITVDEALKHPNWVMGKKITVDSATLMNKALEIIEAHFLFDLKPEQIDVVIHPESVIHSMVQFCDGAVIAQLSPPDMRLPISYALNYPDRLETELKRTDFARLRALTFEEVDQEKFPAIRLAYNALKERGLTPLALNAANEVAVEAFLAGKIKFPDIYAVVERVMAKKIAVTELSLQSLVKAELELRQQASEFIEAGTLVR